MTRILTIQNLEMAQSLITNFLKFQTIDKSQNVLIDIALDGNDHKTVRDAFTQAGNPDQLTLSLTPDAFLVLVSTAMHLNSENAMKAGELHGKTVPITLDPNAPNPSHRIAVADRQAVPA